jgi:hypothetical protein
VRKTFNAILRADHGVALRAKDLHDHLEDRDVVVDDQDRVVTRTFGLRCSHLSRPRRRAGVFRIGRGGPAKKHLWRESVCACAPGRMTLWSSPTACLID